MKINLSENIKPLNSYPVNNIQAPQQSASFKGLKFKNDLIKDIINFKHNSSDNGLAAIKGIKSGDFGTICKGSIPLKNFLTEFGTSEIAYLFKKGVSTNCDGFPKSFLKTSADNPVSTSYVHDCSAFYLYNKDTNTHFLYHASPYDVEEELNFMIKRFMKEGYTKADIIPGSNQWTETHQETLPLLFNVIKNNNPDTVINVHHYSSKFPEITGYKGEVYEIPNQKVNIQLCDKPEDYGQASFEISDIQKTYTLEKIEVEGNSSQKLSELRKHFENQNYDSEIKKVLNELIAEREREVAEIEACSTFEELKDLISMYNPSYVLKHFEAFDIQKQKIIKMNIINE